MHLNQESFDHVQGWLKELEYHGCSDVVKVLVGNKCEKTDRYREVDFEAAQVSQCRTQYI